MSPPPVHAYTLSNGLLVLVKEVHSVPVATCWLWYRVGSRNEASGYTGMSHWVEHMLFKGTPTMPKGALDRSVARNGGTFNGFTWIDYTAYFETLPADRIELGLRIESDRMVHALFEPAEVESERTVILAELEGNANYPDTWLDQAVKAAAFTLHPYRQPIIGHVQDLQAMTREDLYQHYQTYYMPNNAVLVLVGDFKAEGMQAQVERYFGALPVGPPLPQRTVREPEPQGERRVVIRRPGPAEYIQMAYLVPDCRHPDFAPLLVLDGVLSGAGSFAGGGVATYRSARLYRALVETALASNAYSSYHPTRDPFLFEFWATVQSGTSLQQVEEVLLHEIEKIQQDGISSEELTKVSKQVRAQVAYGGESVTNQAMLLGMWEVLDSYQRAETIYDELAAVRMEDVQRVARTYLTEQRRTVGHFIPTQEA
jgi:zinc protease